MQSLPPRRGKLSAKRTDEGRVCRNCPIAGLLLRRGRACPARGLLAEGLGPLCEGAPPAGGGGESLAEIRNISGNGKVLSLRPCGATSLAEGGKDFSNCPEALAYDLAAVHNRDKGVVVQTADVQAELLGLAAGQDCGQHPFFIVGVGTLGLFHRGGTV